MFMFKAVFRCFLQVTPPVHGKHPVCSHLLPVVLACLRGEDRLLFYRAVPTKVRSCVRYTYQASGEPILRVIFCVFQGLCHFLVDRVGLRSSPTVPAREGDPLPFPKEDCNDVHVHMYFRSIPPVQGMSSGSFKQLRAPSRGAPVKFKVSYLLVYRASVTAWAPRIV